MRRILPLVITSLALGSLFGCAAQRSSSNTGPDDSDRTHVSDVEVPEERSQGPAEKLGEKIDSAAQAAGEGVREAEHAIKRAYRTTKSRIGRGLKSAGEALSEEDHQPAESNY